MSWPTREELLRIFPPTDDPEILARRRHIAKVLLDADPELKEQLLGEEIEKARLNQMRTWVRRMLAIRKLDVSAEQEVISDDYFCRLATTRFAGRSAVRTACAIVGS